MSSIIGTQPIAIQGFSSPQAAPAVKSSPQPAAPLPPANLSAQVDIQVQTAEQNRYEAVKQASQEAPNVYPLGDRTFTIFKDASGQFVTRYTSLRDGRVTYSPELVTLKPTSSAYKLPSFRIKA
jgi:hypothetical protein